MYVSELEVDIAVIHRETWAGTVRERLFVGGKWEPRAEAPNANMLTLFGMFRHGGRALRIQPEFS